MYRLRLPLVVAAVVVSLLGGSGHRLAWTVAAAPLGDDDVPAASAITSWLLTLDVTDPARMQPVGERQSVNGLVYGLVADEQYAYAAVAENGLAVLLLGGAAAETAPVDYRLLSDTPGLYLAAPAVARDGRYAYVAAGRSLRVLDLREPTQPALVGVAELPTIGQGVAVSGQYAYVPAGDYGLLIVDVSDPAAPRLVASQILTEFAHRIASSALAVAVAGQFAYVAAGSGGMQIVDVSAPTSPRVVGVYGAPEQTTAVAVAGPYAYVADYADSLHVVDVSDPARPHVVATYDPPSAVRGLAVADGRAYLATGRCGLRILNLQDRRGPVEVGAYLPEGLVESVAVANSVAAIAVTPGDRARAGACSRSES
ncbi:MAG TPA: hypothetical protein VII06_13305 [Chloroflexota bacterium]|jgi:hypothetical protein